MDPTSFAIGIVSLTSLVSTCIESFQILRGIRSFPRDTEILLTKLDIEKDLFLQWASQVGLLEKQKQKQRQDGDHGHGYHDHGRGRDRDRDRDGTRKGMGEGMGQGMGKGMRMRNLFDERTDSLIARVLGEIRILLEEAEGLEGKYTSGTSGNGICEGNSLGHGERKIGGQYNSARHGEDEGFLRRRQPSFRRKFIWTVHGREEFKCLIDELGYFIGKLYQLIPSLEQRRASVRELREVGADVTTLSMLMLGEGSQSQRRGDGNSERYGDGGGSQGARSRDDESDWNDLASEVASEVASRAESRIVRSDDDDGSRSTRGYVRSRRRRQERNCGCDEQDFDCGRARRRSGSHGSARLHGSLHSHASSGSSLGSYGSSRSTLVEMFGDVVGTNGRLSSGFR